MNEPALGAFAIAAIVSAGNLVAVWRHLLPLEYATKPLVMLLLIAAALLLHPGHEAERALFVIALVLGLLGDVFLMIPRDFLLPGLVAFLGGHLAYIAGFRFGDFSALGLAVGVVIVLATAALVVPHVLRALEAGGRAGLRIPVLAYVAVISLMTVSATASGNPVAAAGGLLFFFSDVIFAWYTFVRPIPWGRPVNIVMYQAGQALLVLSLGVPA